MFNEDSAAGRGEDSISPFTWEKNSIRNKVPLLSLTFDSIVTHLLLLQHSPGKWEHVLQLRVELRTGTLDLSLTTTVFLKGYACVF